MGKRESHLPEEQALFWVQIPAEPLMERDKEADLEAVERTIDLLSDLHDARDPHELWGDIYGRAKSTLKKQVRDPIEEGKADELLYE